MKTAINRYLINEIVDCLLRSPLLIGASRKSSMSRHNLTDEQWAVRKPLIPKKKEKKLNQWSLAALGG
ncbi:MAG: hypothetical protein Q6J44_00265 [Gloeomargarita sp. DG02_4_bins_56]